MISGAVRCDVRWVWRAAIWASPETTLLFLNELETPRLWSWLLKDDVKVGRQLWSDIMQGQFHASNSHNLLPLLVAITFCPQVTALFSPWISRRTSKDGVSNRNNAQPNFAGWNADSYFVAHVDGWFTSMAQPLKFPKASDVTKKHVATMRDFFMMPNSV